MLLSSSWLVFHPYHPCTHLLPLSYTHRLLEIINSKIFSVQGDDVRLDSIHTGGSKLYRVEEVPHDEVTLGEHQALIPVAHFHREMFTTFGVPFILKITDVSAVVSFLLTLYKRASVKYHRQTLWTLVTAVLLSRHACDSLLLSWSSG